MTVIYPPQAPASNTIVLDPPPLLASTISMARRSPGPLLLLRPADSGPPIYLIALRDQTIHAAAAYWVEAGVLHYITLDHQQKQVVLSQVDRDLCVKLNRERHVVFSLPATQ